MKIAVIHATRRPRQALEMRDRWLKATKDQSRITYTFGIDDDDEESLKILANEPHHVSKAGGGCCLAYNETAQLVLERDNPGIFVLCSDDVYPIPEWDRIIYGRLIGTIEKPTFLACSDGRRNPRAIPLQIVNRAWLDHFGYIFHPRFKSMYGDVWMEEIARRNNWLIYARDLVFEHKHPHFGTAPMDEVYAMENAQERYDEGKAALDELLGPAKISLCMIAGNEEPIIEKCLDSAKASFDELCLVSAIGHVQNADKTYIIARDWCAANGKEFRWDFYKNKVEFPHVDDFAAARNLSFSLATGDWQLWLDCDDYLDAINCARIREAVKVVPIDINGIFATYCVESQGAEILRERLIRRTFGNWKNPIHENCFILGDSVECPGIHVFHRDHTAKHQSSARRNADILKRTLEDAPRHYFYLHSELKMLKDKPASIKAGLSALTMLPPTAVEERYMVHLNLSELQPEKCQEHLHECARLQPHRREAFAYLSQLALIENRLSDAVSYFRLMDALPLPKPLPWTHQGLWYGWARHWLRVRLLRATGQKEAAETEHAEHMKDKDYAKNVTEHLERLDAAAKNAQGAEGEELKAIHAQEAGIAG